MGDGISDLIIEALKNLLTPSAMWGYSKKMATYEPGRGLSPNIEVVGTLILDLPASRIVRNKYALFKPPCLWIFVIAAGMD